MLTRIIAGEARGRRLRVPRGARTRPTSERVREAVFSILGPTAVEGAEVLDLFAGTGAMGLEALSRGARHATMVEAVADVASVLKANASDLGWEDRVTVLRRPVAAALRELAARQASFDLVFVDPPYGRGLLSPTLEALAAARLVRPGGIVVAEHSAREDPGSAFDGLRRVEVRRYGDTAVSLFRPGESWNE